MDQSNRYSDLSLKEKDLIKQGKHILVAYTMQPNAGYDYLATASHFAAESSTGTNVSVSTTDDFTRGVDAIVYYANEADNIIKIAYPNELFDRNITDGRTMIVSFLTLAIGNNQGMGDVKNAQMQDFYVPLEMLNLFDGPSRSINDLWRLLGRDINNGGFIVGTIIKPKLGLRPQQFAKAAYEFWLGGDFIKNDEPQGNQLFCPMKEVMPLVHDSMMRAQDDTGEAKIFSMNITADDYHEMCARADYGLEVFGEDAPRLAFLVDGYVGGPGMVTTARRQYPHQYLHYHRAGHGAITSPSSKRGYTSFVLGKLARLMGASGIHVGTMSYGKMEGSKDDKLICYMLERDECQGPFFYQKWYGMKPTTSIISGGLNAVRLPGFFENLGHGNVIATAGGGSYGHIDSATDGAKSLRQAYNCWLSGADPIEFAKEHREFARAFESFPSDADNLFPNWRDKLGVK